MGLGTHSVSASIPNSDGINAGSASTTFEVVAGSSTISLDLDESEVPYGGSFKGTVPLSRDSDGGALAGRTVVLYLNRAEIGRGVTDSNGVWAFSIPAEWKPGSYELLAVYGGENNYSGSSASVSITVTKADSVFEVKDAAGKRGDVIPMHCWLRRASDQQPINNALVKWYLDSEYLGSGRSNGSGYDGKSLITAGRNRGKRKIHVVFDGNDYFNASEGWATVEIK